MSTPGAHHPCRPPEQPFQRTARPWRRPVHWRSLQEWTGLSPRAACMTGVPTGAEVHGCSGKLWSSTAVPLCAAPMLGLTMQDCRRVAGYGRLPALQYLGSWGCCGAGSTTRAACQDHSTCHVAADHVGAVDDGGSAAFQHSQQALPPGPLRLRHPKSRAFAASVCPSAVLTRPGRAAADHAVYL